jgi:cobalamin transport system ATP-binding protein
MLSIQSLTASYGIKIVLNQISLEVHPGEVVGLIGPNGAGKTTVMRAISGVLPIRSGQITVFGEDIAKFSASQRARYLAVVPQARRLPPDYTIWQTVLMGRTPYLGWLGKPSSVDRDQVSWALDRTGLKDLADRRADELSGGEQQLVLIARALAQNTPILLLDEPTAHLDLQHQSTILTLINELAHENQLAVLMSLHDLNLVSLFANRVALLSNGSIRAVGDPQHVFTYENLSAVYRVPVTILTHPNYGTPLILLDGKPNTHINQQQNP